MDRRAAGLPRQAASSSSRRNCRATGRSSPSTARPRPALTKFAAGFCRKLAENGLLFPHWPKEIGGEGKSPWEQQILAEVMWEWGEPRGGQYMNVNWIGPTMVQVRHRGAEGEIPAADRQRRNAVVPGLFRAKFRLRPRLACAPGPSSEETTHYRVNGQKIWTSYAGLADTCFLLTRTSDDRKRGITILLVPMDTPGHHRAPDPQPDRRGRYPRGVLRRRHRARQPALRRGRPGLGNHQLLADQRAARHPALSSGAHRARPGGGHAQGRRRLDGRRGEDRGRPLRRAVRGGAHGDLRHRPEARRRRDGRAGSQLGPIRHGDEPSARCANSSSNIVPEALAGGSAFLQMHHQRGIVAGVASGAAEIQLNIVASRRARSLPREPR